MHFSQQESRFQLFVERGDDLLQLRAAGFVSVDLLSQLVLRLRMDFSERLPSRILLDVRDVAGYDDGCASLAREWLNQAHGSGVTRIALVASSSVLRTSIRVMAANLELCMQCFERDGGALSWLKSNLDVPLVPSIAAGRHLAL